jgi:hypothetical protein
VCARLLRLQPRNLKRRVRQISVSRYQRAQDIWSRIAPRAACIESIYGYPGCSHACLSVFQKPRRHKAREHWNAADETSTANRCDSVLPAGCLRQVPARQIGNGIIRPAQYLGYKWLWMPPSDYCSPDLLRIFLRFTAATAFCSALYVAAGWLWK